MSASISINGALYSGKNITITNGVVKIDGAIAKTEGKDIRIEVLGDVATLDIDHCAALTIAGGAGKVTTVSGDVRCGDVAGAVRTMSGDIDCGAVGGYVETMSGDITHR